MDKSTLLSTDDALVRECLTAAGWHLGRRVDVDEWEQEWHDFGMPMFPSARAVLMEFGGLVIRPVVIPKSLFMIQEIEIDPMLCDPGKVELWIEQLGRPVFPLGHSDHFPILIDEAENVYFDGHEAEVWGNSFSDALQFMIRRDRETEVLPQICTFDAEGCQRHWDALQADPNTRWDPLKKNKQ